MFNCRRKPLVIIAFVACLSLALPIAGAQDLIVKGGWMFDAVGDAVQRNTAIVIRGGSFTQIGVDPGTIVAASATVMELADDDYILPGIFDLHAHYNINVAGLGRIDETEHYSVIYLANGVTSTFPAGNYLLSFHLHGRRDILIH